MDLRLPHHKEGIPHICVCICTYKRPEMLRRLLCDLGRQESEGLFTYSVVVVDNDESRSGESTVATFSSTCTISAKYSLEPKRGIYRARNRTLADATGDFLAIIDDDEFPCRNWLLALFKSCNEYKVDGVLGPVMRHFDEVPPMWLKRSQLYERRVNPTGTPLDWREGRTGNVLLRKEVVEGDIAPFREDLKSGGDTEFFRRKATGGWTFIWCAEAVVFEVVPCSRWKRKYLVRKAFMRGDSCVKRGDLGVVSIAKSVVAVPLYALALPFAQLLGHHRFMTLLVRLCDHLGKLLALVGLHPVRGEYV